MLAIIDTESMGYMAKKRGQRFDYLSLVKHLKEQGYKILIFVVDKGKQNHHFRAWINTLGCKVYTKTAVQTSKGYQHDYAIEVCSIIAESREPFALVTSNCVYHPLFKIMQKYGPNYVYTLGAFKGNGNVTIIDAEQFVIAAEPVGMSTDSSCDVHAVPDPDDF